MGLLRDNKLGKQVCKMTANCLCLSHSSSLHKRG